MATDLENAESSSATSSLKLEQKRPSQGWRESPRNSSDRKNTYGSFSDSLNTDRYQLRAGDSYTQYFLGDYDEVENGWKLHIALDETSPGNVIKAWKVVAPILDRYQIKTFKHKSPGNLGTHQDGRTIAIYLQPNQELADKNCCHRNNRLHDMLTEIDDALTQNDIIPATQQPIADAVVTGSDYLFYRNDTKDAEGISYVDAESSKQLHESDPEQYPSAHNPYKLEDNFRLEELTLGTQFSMSPCAII